MWFTETPWPPIFLCGAMAVLSLAVWRRSGRAVFLYAVIGLGIACIGIYAFEQWYVTEPEEVEKEVFALALAVEADDVDRTVGFISADRLLLRIAVRGGMSQVRIEDGIRVTDVQAAYTEDGKSVVSRFRANGRVTQKGGDAGQHASTMWELTWQKRDGKWQITGIQRLDPLNGDKMGMTDPP